MEDMFNEILQVVRIYESVHSPAQLSSSHTDPLHFENSSLSLKESDEEHVISCTESIAFWSFDTLNECALMKQ